MWMLQSVIIQLNLVEILVSYSLVTVQLNQRYYGVLKGSYDVAKKNIICVLV